MNKESDMKGYGTAALNTLFNPFENNNILAPQSDTEAGGWKKPAYHAAMLGLGYGGVAYALRRLLAEKDRATKKSLTDTMASAANAKNPILSIDPNVDDAIDEADLRGAGIEGDEDIMGIHKSANDEISIPVPSMSAESENKMFDKNWLATALAAAGAAGGLGLGWSMADRVTDLEDKKTLAGRISTSENEIDRALYDEYARTRGLPTQADALKGEKTTPEVNAEYDVEKTAGTVNPQRVAQESALINKDVQGDGLSGAMPFAASAYGVYALAALALSFNASKSFSDDRDPVRNRLKDLKQVGKEMAKVKGAPQFIDATDFPSVSGKPAAQAPAPMTSTKVTGEAPHGMTAPVDSKDPIRDLLR